MFWVLSGYATWCLAAKSRQAESVLDSPNFSHSLSSLTPLFSLNVDCSKVFWMAKIVAWAPRRMVPAGR